MALITKIVCTSVRYRSTGLAGLGFLVCALLFSCGLVLPVQSAPASEYQVKAVFLFNFAQFVEWPPSAFPQSQTPLVIGVLGQDPFGAYLDETVRGERVNNRPLTVRRYRRVEEIQTCHVLFISRSEADRMDQILASLKYRKILTVADGESAAGSRVMIRFVTQQNKIRLRINPEAARAANLSISSKLLRLGGV
ncbi:MAG TPA: YfiR family protein [Pyrinomonadaceae bacterium]|nr:YfiR family protein [Pyrinomonadaceae bacterium]